MWNRKVVHSRASEVAKETCLSTFILGQILAEHENYKLDKHVFLYEGKISERVATFVFRYKKENKNSRIILNIIRNIEGAAAGTRSNENKKITISVDKFLMREYIQIDIEIKLEKESNFDEYYKNIKIEKKLFLTLML